MPPAPLRRSALGSQRCYKMKISLLLAREPFTVIFEETMERHLAVVSGRPCRVRWRERTLRERLALKTQAQEWLCNPLINAIFAPNARRQVLDLPRRWYGTGPTLAKTWAQRAYVTAATSFFGRSVLAGPAIVIDPMPANASALLITGGNTRLRMFDFERGEATTILKSRFDESFVYADLAVRSAHPWLPAPPVLRVLDGGRAYVEPILAGTARARHRALGIAVEACERLGRETAETVPGRTYLSRLLGRCQDLGDLLGVRDRQIAARVGRWTAKMNAAAEAIADDNGFELQIGQSHGDLALGNILAEGDEVYLIDWERTGMRMRGFDATTLALASRRWPEGLTGRARRLIVGDGEFGPAEDAARAALVGRSPRETEAKLMIYLAEELLFHLEENMPSPITPPTLGLKLLLDELEST